MSYAVRNDGQGWRAVNSKDDVVAGETFYDQLPSPTAAQLLAAAQQSQITALQAAYQAAVNTPVSFKLIF